MTQPGRQPAGSAVASGAALIATFYGDHGKLGPLRERLEGAPGRKLLRAFEPPTAVDTSVVQLGLNAGGPAGPAWRAMRKRLETTLTPGPGPDTVWGYTLIYQAELAPGMAPEAALAALLPMVCSSLWAGSPAAIESLASVELAAGWVWLIDVPLTGNGLQAGAVYVALGPPDPENHLVREVLYGPGAALLMPDLIAHKGYHQLRQYRHDELSERYRQEVTALGQTSERIMRRLDGTEDRAAALGRLAERYASLFSVVGHLDALRISLARQVANYAWWEARAGLGEVARFHREQLAMGERELELLVLEGSRPLEAARTAVEIGRAEQEQARVAEERRQEQLLRAAEQRQEQLQRVAEQRQEQLQRAAE